MSRAGRIVALVIFLLVAGAGALFTIQNSVRTTDLSLDLWLVAYHLEEPLPIPHLMWGAFGVGLLLGGIWGLMRRMGGDARTREPSAEGIPSEVPADDDWT